MGSTVPAFVSGLLSGMKGKVFLSGGKASDFEPVLSEREGKRIWEWSAEGVSVRITETCGERSAVYYADLCSEAGFDEKAMTLPLDFSGADALLDIHQDGGGCWAMCSWDGLEKPFEHSTQNLLVRENGTNYSVTCLVADSFRCDMKDRGLEFSNGMKGWKEYHGYFLSVTENEDPLKAVEENYKFARSAGAIRVLLRSEKEYPEMFEKFGWCSWNAFYQQPTSEKIYSKLDEFREKNVPVNWIIIDDGWSPTNENRLIAFEADREKFPEGLKECVRRIKEEYGIKQVGVWHTLQAYWCGLEPGTPLTEKYADSLMTGLWDRIIPINDVEKQFGFWDDWHSYLQDCGIDFVKVDNQMSGWLYYGICPMVEGVSTAYRAIERSIDKHFGGKVINCMGMDMENVLQRPHTAISRNSDDFYPDRENGFAKHITQNVYNAIWHSQMYFCDYDMWWSGRAEPVKSGLLRAVSGGPVYVSDAVGETDASNILPVAGTDGNIFRLDEAGRPTLDIVYTDCAKDGKALKVFNRKGDAFAVAVFNISRREISDSLELSAVEGFPAGRPFVAYEYFTKTFSRADSGTAFRFTLGEDDLRAYSVYPVESDGSGEYIMLGDTGRYVGAGDPEKKKTYLSQLGL